ncbi:hypothetical protein RDWZM_010482 [Blomia tropicalis]|uniref:Phospholipid/glycerol acyltransferase domain-containing protein n=1 Tax=Blomia tropicalis TaxID=40697 RepID=A0A9Q0M138_BLOTA|nr:hypothetical protein RDWZM_010482 [Blomia tropicalis]
MRQLFAILRIITFISAAFMVLYGKIFYDYEIKGFEHIPPNGPLLLIYYHGILPMDMILFPFVVYLRDRRIVYSVVENSFESIPYLNRLTNRFAFLGPLERCIRVLNDGNLLQISPGGMREAMYSSDKTYELIWSKRKGFAKAAKEAEVNIVPVFTTNIRHLAWTFDWIQRLLRPLYEKTRIPMVVFLGGFPVKLTTYIGEQIFWDYGETDQELATKTRLAVEEQIKRYQKLPLSTWDAVKERFCGKETGKAKQ